MSGFHTNLTSKIPITIGTVPVIAAPTAPPISGDNVAVNMDPQHNNTPQLGWVGPQKGRLYPSSMDFYLLLK